MNCHCVAGTFVIMMLNTSMLDGAVNIQLSTPALAAEKGHKHNPAALQVTSRQLDLHCIIEIMPCIFSILMEQDAAHNFYIIDEGSTEDTSSALGKVVQHASIAGATASLVQRKSILLALRQAVQWTGTKSSIVIALSPAGNITALFKDVHEGWTADPKLKWLVLTKEDISASIEKVIREETQVVLVLQQSQGRHKLMTSYVNEQNQVKFKKVGSCHCGVGSGCKCSTQRPLFPSPLEAYQDFYGRQLLVATVNNVPYFKLYRFPDGTVASGEGVDYNVIHAIAHFLNFTVQVVEPEDRSWGGPLPNGSVYGMVGLVASRLAHVALNEITITGLRESVVDFTEPYIQEGTALVSRAPTERDRSLAVFSPFSLPVWTLLIIVTLTMGLLSFLVSLGHDYCTTVVRNDSPRQIGQVRTLFTFCFNMYRTLVLQGNPTPARASPARAFLFAWYLFGIIIYALYAGNLTSFLTKPFFETPINSLQDLKESSHRGFVPAVQPSTSQESLLKNAKTGIFRELWELMEPIRSFPKSGLQAMEKVLTEDIVYISGSLNLEIRASQKGRERFYISSDTFLPQLFGIACFPGAPFKDKFSIMLGRMVEGGLVAKWVEDEVYKLRDGGPQPKERGQPERATGMPSLALDHLQGTFIILACGSLASTLFFVTEILRHRAAATPRHTSNSRPLVAVHSIT